MWGLRLPVSHRPRAPGESATRSHRGLGGSRRLIVLVLGFVVATAGAVVTLPVTTPTAEAATVYESPNTDCDPESSFVCLQDAYGNSKDAGGVADLFTYDWTKLDTEPIALTVNAQFPEAEFPDPGDERVLRVYFNNVLRLSDAPGFTRSDSGEWVFDPETLDAKIATMITGATYTEDRNTIGFGLDGVNREVATGAGMAEYRFNELTVGVTLIFKVAASWNFGAGAAREVSSAAVGDLGPGSVIEDYKGAPIRVETWRQSADPQSGEQLLDSSAVERVDMDNALGLVMDTGSVMLITSEEGRRTASAQIGVSERRRMGKQVTLAQFSYHIRVTTLCADHLVPSSGSWRVTPAGSSGDGLWTYYKVEQVGFSELSEDLAISFLYNAAKVGAEVCSVPGDGTGGNPVGLVHGTNADGTFASSITLLDGSTFSTTRADFFGTWNISQLRAVPVSGPRLILHPIAEGENQLYPDDERNWLSAVRLENAGADPTEPFTATVRNETPLLTGVRSIVVRHTAAQTADGATCSAQSPAPCGIRDINVTLVDSAGRLVTRLTLDSIPVSNGATMTEISVAYLRERFTDLARYNALNISEASWTYVKGIAPTTRGDGYLGYYLAAEILLKGVPIATPASQDYSFVYELDHPTLPAPPGGVPRDIDTSATTTYRMTLPHAYGFTGWSSQGTYLDFPEKYYGADGNIRLSAGSYYENATLNYRGEDYLRDAGSAKFVIGRFSAFLMEDDYLAIDTASIELLYDADGDGTRESVSKATDPDALFTITPGTYRIVDSGTGQLTNRTSVYYRVTTKEPFACKRGGSNILLAAACPTVRFDFAVRDTAPTSSMRADSFVRFGFNVEPGAETPFEAASGGNTRQDREGLTDATNTINGMTKYDDRILSFTTIPDVVGGISVSTDGVSFQAGFMPGNTEVGVTAVTIDSMAKYGLNYRLDLTNNTGLDTRGNTVAWIPVPKQGEATDLMPDDPSLFQRAFDLQPSPFEWSLALDSSAQPKLTTDGRFNRVELTYATDYSLARPGADDDAFKTWAEIQAAGQVDEVRMVRVSVPDNFPDGGRLSVVLSLAFGDTTTSGGSYTDAELLNLAGRMNVYASRVYREVEGRMIGYYNTNFAALKLKTARVSGVVFDDTNRNGVKNTVESFLPGVVVQAFAASDPHHLTPVTSKVATDENGAYILTLDSVAPVDVVFTNPYSPCRELPSAANNYRQCRAFHPFPEPSLPSDTQQHSVVTPSADGKSAWALGVNPSAAAGTVLSDGEVAAYNYDMVSAGLISPSEIRLVPGVLPRVVNNTSVNAIPTFSDGATSRTMFRYYGETIPGTVDPVTGRDEHVPSSPGHTHLGWSPTEGATEASWLNVAGRQVTADSVQRYYAVWERHAYDVTLDARRGTVLWGVDDAGNPLTAASEVQTRPVTYAEMVTLPTPLLEGYTFISWCSAIDSSGNASGTCRFTSASPTYVQGATEATTLYARWSLNRYRFSFDANGGQYDGDLAASRFDLDYFGTYAANATTNGSWPDPAGLTPPAPDVGEDYLFGGWWTRHPNGAWGREYFPDTQLRLENLGCSAAACDIIRPANASGITGAVTLYARWFQRGHLVLDANANGTEIITPADPGTTQLDPDTLLDRTSSATFAGRDVRAYHLPDESVSPVSYSDKSYSIKRPGYLFSGWLDLADEVAGPTPVADGTYSWATPAVGERDYYMTGLRAQAQWTPLAGDVVLDYNDAYLVNLGGSEVVGEVTVPGALTYDRPVCAGVVEEQAHGCVPAPPSGVVGQPRFQLPQPERDGYTFDGWWLQDEAGEWLTAIGEHTAWTDSSLTGDETTLSTVTLHARWRMNLYTLDYLAQRGDSEPAASRTIRYGEQIPTDVTPALVGHTFTDSWTLVSDSLGGEYEEAVTAGSPTVFAHGDRPDGTHFTLTAVWEPSRFRIVFEPLGGTMAPDSEYDHYGTDAVGPDGTARKTMDVTYGERTAPLPSASRTGYVLKDWVDDPQADPALVAGRARGSVYVYRVADDTTLYARWTPLLTVITLYAGADANVEGATRTTVTVPYDGTLILPTPYRDGYKFLGWYSERNGQGDRYTSGTTWTKDVRKFRLYAAWDGMGEKPPTPPPPPPTPPITETYAVKVISGGDPAGLLGPQPELVKLTVKRGKGTGCSNDKNTVCLKAGQTFRSVGASVAASTTAGWKVEAWGYWDGSVWTAFDPATTKVTKDIVLQPRWLRTGYPLTLESGFHPTDRDLGPLAADIGAGTNLWGATASAQTHGFVVNKDKPLSTVLKLDGPGARPTAKGYTFAGWVCVLGCASPQPFQLTDDLRMPAGPMTLKATWKRDVYRVVFNLVLPPKARQSDVRRDVPPPVAEVKYGDKVAEPAGYQPPEIYAFDFIGWRTDPALRKSDFTLGTTPAFVPDHGATLNLWALWREGGCPVTLDLNLGDGVDFSRGPATVLDAADPAAALLPAVYVKAGVTLKPTEAPQQLEAVPNSHTFTGWSRFPVADSEADLYDFGGDDPIACDDVLFAQWQRRAYIVTFDANSGEGQDGRPKTDYVIGADIAQQVVAYGVSPAEVVAPTAEGFLLAGWNTSADGSGQSFVLGDKGTQITGSTVLYAQWIRQDVLALVAVLFALGMVVMLLTGGRAVRRRRDCTRQALPVLGEAWRIAGTPTDEREALR